MKAWLVCIAWLAAGLARADGPSDEDARKLSKQHFRAGEKAYKANNFAAAAANFEEAYKAFPQATKDDRATRAAIAYGAAQAHRKQYRVEPRLELARRALELYRVYLDVVKTGGEVGKAADYVGEMQREVDKLVAAGARAAREAGVERTRLGVSPLLASERRSERVQEIGEASEGESIAVATTIDGVAVTPFQMVDVAPGVHVVRATAPGYLPHESTARVVRGASTVAEVILQPRPARVTVATEQGARITVDGRVIGSAPLAAFDLGAGKHLITVTRAGRETSSREVDLARGEEARLRVALAKTGRRRAVPYVATAAALLGALAVTSGAFGYVEHRRAADLLSSIQAGDQRPDAADRRDRNLARRDELLAGAVITGGAALAFGVAAAALYWLDRPSETGLRLAPTMTPGAAGVTLGRRF